MVDKKEEDKWAEWTKKRVFVREVAGKYGEIFEGLLKQPRVYKTRQNPYTGGPVAFGRQHCNPGDYAITQCLNVHEIVQAPGGHGQVHGHMNGALMYVLEGEGHEIHDGVRYDWEAGDAILVGNARVHQHNNNSNTKQARLLVIKTKPLFMFLNLFLQKTVALPPSKPLPGYEDFKPAD